MTRLDLLDEIETVVAVEHEIDDHEIGAAGLDGRECGGARADRAVDDEAGLGLDEGGEASPQHRMIVDDEERLATVTGRVSWAFGHRPPDARQGPAAETRR